MTTTNKFSSGYQPLVPLTSLKVDLLCSQWFIETDWVKLLFREKWETSETGEVSLGFATEHRISHSNLEVELHFFLIRICVIIFVNVFFLFLGNLS